MKDPYKAAVVLGFAVLGVFCLMNSHETAGMWLLIVAILGVL